MTDLQDDLLGVKRQVGPDIEFERMVCSFMMPDFDEMIRLLERHGDRIDVNQTGKIPYTALERACSHGRLDAVKALVAHGADVNLQAAMMFDDLLMFMSPPPVVYAIDYIDVLEYLVDNGVRFEYTLKHVEKSRVFNILTTTMIRFGSLRRLGADRTRLLHKMLDIGLRGAASTTSPIKKELLQIVLKYHHVFFRFLPHLAALGVRLDADFDFYDMELLPNRKNRWWECPRVVACVLRRCTDAILHKNIYDPRRHAFFTLQEWLPHLFGHVSVVNSLSPRSVLHYRRAGCAHPELLARYMRVRFLCFRLYEAHIRRRYHPDRFCVDWEDDEIYKK